MNSYLKENIPKLSLILISILFLTNILTLIVPEISQYILLYPDNLNQPLNWYRFLTYPLYVGGLLAWIHNSLVIILTGFILENRLDRKELIWLILLSNIIGGLIFIYINKTNGLNIPIASPTMISWGYWSAAIVTGIAFWKRINLFEKIVVILCLLSITNIWDENIGFLIGQIIVILTIFKTIKTKKTGYNKV